MGVPAAAELDDYVALVDLCASPAGDAADGPSAAMATSLPVLGPVAATSAAPAVEPRSRKRRNTGSGTLSGLLIAEPGPEMRAGGPRAPPQKGVTTRAHVRPPCDAKIESAARLGLDLYAAARDPRGEHAVLEPPTAETLARALTAQFGSWAGLMEACGDPAVLAARIQGGAHGQWTPWLLSLGRQLCASYATARDCGWATGVGQAPPFATWSDALHCADTAEAAIGLAEPKGSSTAASTAVFGEALPGTTPAAVLGAALHDLVAPILGATRASAMFPEKIAYALLQPGPAGEAGLTVLETCMASDASLAEREAAVQAIRGFRSGTAVAVQETVASLRGGRRPSCAGLGPQDGPVLALAVLKVEQEGVGQDSGAAGRGSPALSRKRSFDDMVAPEPGPGPSRPGAQALLVERFGLCTLRVLRPGAADGRCGFSACALQLGVPHQQTVGNIVAEQLQSPSALEPGFGPDESVAAATAERAALVRSALEGGAFSEGHARALAEATKRRVLILPGAGTPSRGLEIYGTDAAWAPECVPVDPDDMEAAVRGVSDSDIVLVRSRGPRGLFAYAALVPASPMEVVGAARLNARALTSGDVCLGAKNGGGFKCTGLYRNMEPVEAWIAFLLVKRCVSEDFTKRRYRQAFGFACATGFANMLAAVRRLLGAPAFLSKAKEDDMSFKAIVDQHRRAHAENKRRREGGSRVLERRSPEEYDERRNRNYRSFRLHVRFLVAEVMHGGPMAHARYLAGLGVRMQDGSMIGLQDLEKLARTRFRVYLQSPERVHDPGAAATASGMALAVTAGRGTPGHADEVDELMNLSAECGLESDTEVGSQQAYV